MRYLLFTFIALMLWQCGPSDRELATKLLQSAEALQRNSKYNDAKILLDSLVRAYPEENEVITKAKLVRKDGAIKEQERNMHFLDSLLQLKSKELKPLMVNFKLVVNEEGDSLLIHRYQNYENSFNRSYIKANLNIKGDFYLSSQYVGESPIFHTLLKAVAGESVAQTADIPEDGLQNRRFEDEDTFWEIITLRDGMDNGIADLIAKNRNSAVRVELRGKSVYTIYLESYDKEAISDGYEISFVLKEINRLKIAISNAQRTIVKLKRE